MDRRRVVITEYMIYRAQMRGFDTSDVETIVRYSEERYFDVETRRMIAVGHSCAKLVMVPYDETEEEITPVTIHPVLVAACGCCSHMHPGHTAANPISCEHREVCL